MHKTLAAPDDDSKAAGLSYVNERLLHLVAPRADDRILDAGCGFGGTIFHWQARAGGTYDGLTLSRVQLDAARREAQRRALGDVCGSTSVATTSLWTRTTTWSWPWSR